MVSITVSIPDELRKKMEEFPEINWSGLVRKIITQKIRELAWKEEMLKQLKEEEKYIEESLRIGDKIKEGMWKKYKKEGWGK